PSPGAEVYDDFTAVGLRPAAGDETGPHQPGHEAGKRRGIDAGELGKVDLALPAVAGKHGQDAPHGDAEPVHRQGVRGEADRQRRTDAVDEVGKIIAEIEARATQSCSTSRVKPASSTERLAGLSKPKPRNPGRTGVFPHRKNYTLAFTSIAFAST